jgi:hypothetical protein
MGKVSFANSNFEKNVKMLSRGDNEKRIHERIVCLLVDPESS